MTSTPTCAPPSQPPSSDCPVDRDIDVDPRVAEVTVSGGITVEPLQEPAFPDPLVYPPRTTFPDQNPDPATWDRSETPAGACVFRLWGLDAAACQPTGGTFFVGSCAALTPGRPAVAPGSYYDVRSCGVAPGCPTAEPYSYEPGYWWYFGESGVVDGGEVFTDLVICAPECANSFAMYGGCLRLPSKSGF